MQLLNKFEVNGYMEILKAAFPKRLAGEVENVIRVLPLDNNVAKLDDGKMDEVSDLIHLNTYEVSLNSEQLIIPYRLYFRAPKDSQVKNLSKIERDILHCIYLRHHNGYLRENSLIKLIHSNHDFIIPFVIQLLGEYVFEILIVLEQHLNETNLDLYKSFIEENPKYWLLTENRMISYWNAYYRRKFPNLKAYLGYKIVQKINTNAQQT